MLDLISLAFLIVVSTGLVSDISMTDYLNPSDDKLDPCMSNFDFEFSSRSLTLAASGLLISNDLFSISSVKLLLLFVISMVLRESAYSNICEMLCELSYCYEIDDEKLDESRQSCSAYNASMLSFLVNYIKLFNLFNYKLIL